MKIIKFLKCFTLLQILLISYLYNFDDDKNYYNFNYNYYFQSFSENFFNIWLQYFSFNFEINYYTENNIKDIINNIDKAYNFIINDLDYIFYNNTKKIKIYIYKTQQEYIRKTDINGWAAGHTDIKKNSIYTFEQKNLLYNVIVHELTHLIFDNYMGLPRNISISWLHEGIAMYEDKRFNNKKWDLTQLKYIQIPHLKEIFKANMCYERDEKKISAWYLIVGTIIAYLHTLDRFGFKLFCENLKKYKNLDSALNATYPWDFKNVNELDKKYKKWLKSQKNHL